MDDRWVRKWQVIGAMNKKLAPEPAIHLASVECQILGTSWVVGVIFHETLQLGSSQGEGKNVKVRLELVRQRKPIL